MKKKKWVLLDKEVGQTPLQAVEAFKNWYPGYADAKMAYAGRLDPMASGKLLVLVGDECKKQDYYHGLDKTYEVEIMLGAKSDSGDVLGLVEQVKVPDYPRNKLIGVVRALRGPFREPYPHFSSKTVNGKPLHMWALMGKLHEITIPKQNGYIYHTAINSVNKRTGQEIYDEAVRKIRSLPTVTDESKVLGADFRREAVLGTWNQFLNDNAAKEFTIVKITCTCSSGTYMRSLAEVIGTKLGTSGLAFSIHRTEIGRQLWLPFGFSFWMHRFTR